MTIVFAGNEREPFGAIVPSVTEVTTASTFNSTYCRSSLLASGSLSTITTPALGSLATSYTRFDFYSAFVSNSGRVFARWYNALGVEVFRLIGDTSFHLQMAYWNGASFINIGSPYTLVANTLITIEVKIVCGGSGSAELSVNNTSIGTGSASMTLVTDIDKVVLVDNIGGGSAMYYSRLMVATVPMVSWQQFVAPATSNGSDSTDGTGTFTDINELPFNDATLINLPTAGNRRDFKSASRSLGAGTVVGVTVTARAQKGLTGPSKIKFYVVQSSTRYYSPDIPLTTTFTGYEYTWETNPATGLAWTTTAAGDANLEWGWEAVT